MEITPETETKHEKMFYLSTSSSPSQNSEEKCEENVSIPITDPGRQNNPQRVFDANTTNVSSASSTTTASTTFICDSEPKPCSSSSNSDASCMTEAVVNSIFIPEHEHETIQGKATLSLTEGSTCSSLLLDPCTDIPCQKEKSFTDEQGNSKTFLSLLDLAWEDILFSNLLPYLRWEDLFNLRATCKGSKEMVDEYISKLKCVNLSQQSQTFTADALEVLTTCCTKLRTLILTDCAFVNDDDLILFFQNNRLLSHFDISGCRTLHGRCLLSLTVNCKNLKILKLKDCNWITRGAVDTIIAQLKELEEVDFSSCSVICNQQLIPLAHAFPGIKVLHIANIHSVNDATLVALSRSCRNIHTLDIRSCANVTDNGLRSVIEYCSNLRQVFVANCTQITEYGISLLRRKQNIVIDRPSNQLAQYLELIPRVQV